MTGHPAASADAVSPPATEKANGDFVRTHILNGTIRACHDVSDGGVLVAIAEMAMASGTGARMSAHPRDIPGHAFWFGEDQARYVVTAKHADEIVRRAAAAGVPLTRIGATGDGVLAIAGERPLPVDSLKHRFEAWLPSYVDGAA